MIAPSIAELERRIERLQTRLERVEIEHGLYKSACEEGLVGIFEWRPKENYIYVSENLQKHLTGGGSLPADPYDWWSFVFRADRGNIGFELKRCSEVPCTLGTPLVRMERANVWGLVTAAGENRLFLFRWRVLCDTALTAEVIQGVAVDLTDDLEEINAPHFQEIPF
ncbi:MAG: hypothetical protein KF708_07750 [Pirellulales bacterium]|nr:hypothetical protein [Pirellulales bacterium]